MSLPGEYKTAGQKLNDKLLALMHCVNIIQEQDTPSWCKVASLNKAEELLDEAAHYIQQALP